MQDDIKMCEEGREVECLPMGLCSWCPSVPHWAERKPVPGKVLGVVVFVLFLVCLVVFVVL